MKTLLLSGLILGSTSAALAGERIPYGEFLEELREFEDRPALCDITADGLTRRGLPGTFELSETSRWITVTVNLGGGRSETISYDLQKLPMDRYNEMYGPKYERVEEEGSVAYVYFDALSGTNTLRIPREDGAASRLTLQEKYKALTQCRFVR